MRNSQKIHILSCLLLILLISSSELYACDNIIRFDGYTVGSLFESDKVQSLSYEEFQKECPETYRNTCSECCTFNKIGKAIDCEISDLSIDLIRIDSYATAEDAAIKNQDHVDYTRSVVLKLNSEQELIIDVIWVYSYKWIHPNDSYSKVFASILDLESLSLDLFINKVNEKGVLDFSVFKVDRSNLLANYRLPFSELKLKSNLKSYSNNIEDNSVFLSSNLHGYFPLVPYSALSGCIDCVPTLSNMNEVFFLGYLSPSNKKAQKTNRLLGISMNPKEPSFGYELIEIKERQSKNELFMECLRPKDDEAESGFISSQYKVEISYPYLIRSPYYEK